MPVPARPFPLESTRGRVDTAPVRRTLALAVLALLPGCGGDPSGARAASRGTRALEEGDANAAIPLLERATADPAAPAAWRYSLGVAYRRAGRLGDAERSWIAALEADPEHARTLHALGVLRATEGNHSEAEDLLSRSLAREPGDPIARVNRARTRMALGRPEDARADLTEALVAAPDDPHALEALGDLQAQAGEFDDAIATWARLHRIDPRRAAGLRRRIDRTPPPSAPQ